jgi:hypothetical protein
VADQHKAFQATKIPYVFAQKGDTCSQNRHHAHARSRGSGARIRSLRGISPVGV